MYCHFKEELKSSYFFPGPETFHGLGEYFKLAIPSTLLMIFDWWCFEILAIYAGFISVEATGA